MGAQCGMQFVFFQIQFFQLLALTACQFEGIKAARCVDESLVMLCVHIEQHLVPEYLVLASVALHGRDGLDQHLAALGSQYALYQCVLALADQPLYRDRGVDQCDDQGQRDQREAGKDQATDRFWSKKLHLSLWFCIQARGYDSGGQSVGRFRQEAKFWLNSAEVVSIVHNGRSGVFCRGAFRSCRMCPEQTAGHKG